MTADLILTNADILTMNPNQPNAEILAIKGNQVWFAGSKDELNSVTGAGTKVVDCQSGTVVPGFVDAHCHIFSLMTQLLRDIDLSPASVSSIADIKALISQGVRSNPPGKWLIGTNYDDFYLAEKRHPTRKDIDGTSPYHPVLLIHRSLHACVLNSLALQLIGISNETSEPPNGLINRDLTTGEPDGILFNMLAYVTDKLSPLSEEDMARTMQLASRYYLSCGITSLHDATVSNDLERWQALRRFKEKGTLRSRLYMMFGAEAHSQFSTQDSTQRQSDAGLSLGGVKIILDQTKGEIRPSQAELNQQVFNLHKAGLQIAFHAMEQIAVESAITALEYALARLPRPGHRHRIEHCSECPPELVKRLRNLQVIIVTQPSFLYYHGERYLATMGSEQLGWLYRVKSFVNEGLIVAGSSDSPVVPANPLIGMYAAVTRRAKTGQIISPEESVSASQALATYTINGAYSSFEEKIKGSLTPGKIADIVVLDGNPTKLPLEAIKDIRVQMTILDGKIVWEG